MKAGLTVGAWFGLEGTQQLSSNLKTICSIVRRSYHLFGLMVGVPLTPVGSHARGTETKASAFGLVADGKFRLLFPLLTMPATHKARAWRRVQNGARGLLMSNFPANTAMLCHTAIW